MDLLTSILLGVAVVVYILAVQLRERPVNEERGIQAPLILVIAGSFELLAEIYAHPRGLDLLSVLLIAASLFVGIIFGVIRATKTHVWYDKGQLMRQGSYITVLLWVFGIAIHLFLEQLGDHLNEESTPVTGASILVYVGLSLAVQRFVTLERAKIIRKQHRKETGSITTAHP